MLAPVVSVIIPTFNRAHCLGSSVRSALSQEGFGEPSQLEVLVVDDGSTDGTKDLLAKEFGSDSRLRYFHQENAGVSAARNRGLREARGTLIAFLDSDDLWLPGKLKLQLECLKQLPQVGMVWTDMNAIDARGNITAERYIRTMYRAYRWFPELEDLFQEKQKVSGVDAYWGDIFSPMVLGNLVHTSTVLMRKERLAKVGLFREDFRRGGEDYEFHLRTCREGPVAYLDLPTLEYRVGFEDALTRPENNAAMASAYLETLLGVLAKDRSRLNLAPGRLETCLADAYSWLGRELLVGGRVKGARANFAKSLRFRLWQPSQVKYMLASLLPVPIQALLLRLKRDLR